MWLVWSMSSRSPPPPRLFNCAQMSCVHILFWFWLTACVCICVRLLSCRTYVDMAGVSCSIGLLWVSPFPSPPPPPALAGTQIERPVFVCCLVHAVLSCRTYADMAGEELVAKYQTIIFLAGSASAEFFADMALSPFEAVKVRWA